MADELKALKAYPEVNFIEGYTLSALVEDMTGWFREKWEEETGKPVTLAKGDERRLLLEAAAYYLWPIYVKTDEAGKMALLKYAKNGFLENLGAMKRVARAPADSANVTIRFSLQEARTSATPIPKGTRVTAGNNLYFATDAYEEIPAGSLYADIGATCTETGEKGNQLSTGDITTLVDAVPFVASVTNVTKPENGRDVESDESLRQSIYLAPDTSTGTESAYEYYARKHNPDIADIKVTSPSERIVRIVYLLSGGKIPGKESLDDMQEYMMQNSVRMLTDKIEVKAPTEEPYHINLTYFISSSERESAQQIQESVKKAIEEFKQWQSEKIGRDVNPNEPTARIMRAGAKRVEVTEPQRIIVGKEAVAALGQETIVYGGIEDE